MAGDQAPRDLPRESYVELRTKTAFSFLRGASRPEEIVERAAFLGYRRIAITDRDGLYGVVRAHRAAKICGLEVLVGAEVPVHGARRAEALDAPHDTPRPVEDAPVLALLPTDRAAYGRLSRLITLGKLRVGKGGFDLGFEDVEQHHEGSLAIWAGAPDPLLLARARDVFGDRLSIAIERTLTPFDRIRIEAAQSASARFGVPLVATGGVLMHDPARKPLQDILSCIRMGVRLEEAGRRLLPNAFAHLKGPKEMAHLFAGFEGALQRSVEIADQCRFRLDELRHEFALEILPPGETAMGYLEKLVEKGALERYAGTVPADVRAQIEHEMRLIEELDFAGYFLTVWDIVRHARSRGILCQGRGSAANSVVCYVLGITAIDPVRMNLLFERFISIERGEPPDIDVDFENERREEVMQYVYDKYGRAHAAMVANVITYRGRSAFREVGKVFGLADDQIDRLSALAGDLGAPEDHEGSGEAKAARELWEKSRVEREARDGVWAPAYGIHAEMLRTAGLDPEDRTVRQVIHWANELRGLPRHLGLHSGGFLITRQPIVEMVPVENATMALRTVIAWDKDDVEALGFYKIDLLALGMLSALRRSLELIRGVEGVPLSLATIPSEDPGVYEMISDADTIGTFQVESRAQMQMLPRLRPKTFYDLVISVAIIRPGPIQGDMIHPFLRRRDGLEPIVYPHPDLGEILGRTNGVPLFQEQVMKMAIKVAGFTGGEADELRRAIGWHSKIHIERLHDRLISGMLARGIDLEYAERIFRMMEGFGAYGFPESHAASFALLAYASAFLKRYHPAAFLVGLLNSQPMGFYAPNTLIQDAQRHGVEVRPVSVIHSQPGSTLEHPDEHVAEEWWRRARGEGVSRHSPWADHAAGTPRHGRRLQPAVRLGLRQIRKMSEPDAQRIVKARAERPFTTVADLVARAQLTRELARNLAEAGAFEGLDRRDALWRVAALGEPSSLFAGVELPKNGEAPLPPMTPEEKLEADYAMTGVSVDAHPMLLLRDEMKRQGVRGYRELVEAKDGSRIRIGGLAVTRQRPATASGVIFITLEDEDGHMNLVVFPNVWDEYRNVARDSPLLIAEGRVQRTGLVVNVIVESFHAIERSATPKGRHTEFYRCS